jgi:hypothetical protein
MIAGSGDLICVILSVGCGHLGSVWSYRYVFFSSTFFRPMCACIVTAREFRGGKKSIGLRNRPPKERTAACGIEHSNWSRSKSGSQHQTALLTGEKAIAITGVQKQRCSGKKSTNHYSKLFEGQMMYVCIHLTTHHFFSRTVSHNVNLDSVLSAILVDSRSISFVMLRSRANVKKTTT